MRRAGGLWDELVSFPNFLLAARRAAAGKRSRPDVAQFLLGLESELVQLRREVADGSYRPGEYRTFEIRDPKPRQISAAPFRDRVVHHALTQVLEPVFEPRFSRHSYACRTGFGTHRALERARTGMRNYPYVLQCDVRKYFPSIDHAILRERLERVVKCKRTLKLASTIIEASNSQEGPAVYYPGDDLFTPLDRRTGLPLGNQTSQFFANVYLDPLDQFVERELQPAVFVRYVDDFLCFAPGKRELQAMLPRIKALLDGLRLSLHEGKSRIIRTADGITFLGWRLHPGWARLVRGNVVRFRRRMKRYHRGVSRRDDGLGYDVGRSAGVDCPCRSWRHLAPTGPGVGAVCVPLRARSLIRRVVRGGSYNNNARNLRCSNRNTNEPDNRNNNLGFRCARDVGRAGELTGSGGNCRGHGSGRRANPHFRIANPTRGACGLASNINRGPASW